LVEGEPRNLETAIRGRQTGLLRSLGVLPLALQMEEPGYEIESAMAVVILGGLLTSMVLNLLVLPTLALRYGRFASRENLLEGLQPDLAK
jgi:Cu/Ag efflux pump CusA